MTEQNEAKTRPFPSKNCDLIYRMSTDKWQTQLQQVDSLDAKLGNILGFSGIFLAIFTGFLAVSEGAIPHLVIILLVISFVSFLEILGSTLFAYYVKRWEGGPPLDIAWDYARKYAEDQMYWWAAERFTKSYENNQSKVKHKIYAAQINYTLIIMQAIASTVGLFLVALN